MNFGRPYSDPSYFNSGMQSICMEVQGVVVAIATEIWNQFILAI